MAINIDIFRNFVSLTDLFRSELHAGSLGRSQFIESKIVPNVEYRKFLVLRGKGARLGFFGAQEARVQMRGTQRLPGN